VSSRADLPLEPALFHEFWRLQLLGELRARLRAFQWQPALDPEGRRVAALEDLIARYEAIEAAALRERRFRVFPCATSTLRGSGRASHSAS
jgi:hypothetical protein